MQESEFTGCVNKVQGREQKSAKESSPEDTRHGGLRRHSAGLSNRRAVSKTENVIVLGRVLGRVDASCRFLYDKLVP
jgi:hypothetical protein